MSGSIAACLVVKNEANRIEQCLKPILGLVDQVVIIDTGSSDGTPDLIRQKFGLTVLRGELEESRCLTKIDQRNRAIELATTDWILSIDADEQIDPVGLKTFKSMKHQDDVSGYFGLWQNHIGGDLPFDDYKCFIFRRNFRMRGLVHENAQVDIRSRNGRAVWLDALHVRHFPEYSKHEAKTKLYRRRLMTAIAQEPHWHRYHWFKGYLLSQLGDIDGALHHLSTAFKSDNKLFPVERLNSGMVKAEILCSLGRREEATSTLMETDELWSSVCNDFEVQINSRLKPWIDQALFFVRSGQLSDVRAYRFAR